MNDKQLNIMAASAQDGCEESATEIIRFFLPEINRRAQQIWHLIASEAEFTQNCIVGIYDAIMRFDRCTGNFVAIVRRKFLEARRRFINRWKKRRRGYIVESLDYVTQSNEEHEREVIDELALVDDVLLTNEKIALLAEDDSRKLAILNVWSYGEFNDSHTASFLAKQCGGNAESHRKFITRFRTTCRRALA